MQRYPTVGAAGIGSGGGGGAAVGRDGGGLAGGHSSYSRYIGEIQQMPPVKACLCKVYMTTDFIRNG